MFPVFERVKTFPAVDGTATIMGLFLKVHIIIIIIIFYISWSPEVLLFKIRSYQLKYHIHVLLPSCMSQVDQSHILNNTRNTDKYSICV
jgi:hypothetical protein